MAGLPAIVSGRRAPWRALVAEDNPLNQQVIARQLKALGVSFEVVADGREAFARVMNGGYDVVLMDIQMPVLDGLSATRLIRQWEKDNGALPVKIIAVTANGTASDRLRCLEAGMNDHLAKPLRIADLSAAIHRLLDVPATEVAAPTDTEGGQPELDAATIDGLRELGEDDDTFLRELLDQFRNDSSVRLAGLERAARSGESTVIRALAHALCGSSANVGAIGVSAACRAIEHLRADDDAALYVHAVNTVRRAYNRVIPLLDGLR